MEGRLRGRSELAAESVRCLRMKLILSRKGFDSSAGGVPSPIFPDGKMISLPIPGEEGASNLTYQEIPGNEWASVGELVQQLKARVSSTSPAHLDPDLFAGTVLRKDGWKPLFGQVGASESHLVNQGVGEGDLFLFFGLFRRVEKSTGRWRYVVDSRPMHVIFGWLQIAKRVRVSDWPPDEDWATYHPHFQAQFRLKYSNVSNVVYVATEQLSLPGVASLSIHGAERSRTIREGDDSARRSAPDRVAGCCLLGSYARTRHQV